ncbi:TPA: hypothetical protein QHP60_004157, partial [Escherichia coli]|nr:hypothetical protein [Escherichia coli]
TIQQNLNEAGLKTCCPLILERRRRSDKKNAYRLINSPAFPGYIFVRFNPANIHTTAIKRIPGAMDFVRFGNEIATISQAEIEALKLVHFERPQEKINLPSELKKKIEKITSAEEPAVRIDILFSMLELPTRISRSKNA